MQAPLRTRFWLEAASALMCALLVLLTLVTRDWIEGVTGFNPDHGDGSVEWAIVVALVLVSVLLGVAARSEWRRAKSAGFASA